MYLLGGILGLLIISSIIALILKKTASEAKQSSVDNLLARIKSWWFMCFVFALAALCGKVVTMALFCVMSFLALREFVTIIPTKKADHRALFWLFFIIVPLQYYFLYINWYGMFAIFIPVYAFLFLPMRLVLAGDCEHFLERISKLQWSLMACVYCVSHAPAILNLEVSGKTGEGLKLLLFFTITIQMCDVMQYVWGKLFGKRKIVPSVSPNKTWAGFVGGVLSTGLLGMGLYWITPFAPAQAFFIALAIGCLGFGGDVTMSAIKRDASIKDYGQMIKGHGGVMDRIDSLCFAAPVFFHIVRYFYS